jgi:ubiquinone/menaquinone biosynthesis C-methylase UbiE
VIPRSTVFFPTPDEVIEKMLELADVKENDVLYDLGCGDGRILIKAAKERKVKCVGIEIKKELVDEAQKRVAREGLERLIKIVHGDIFQEDISDATVVYLYLTTELNAQLKPKLEKELKKGTRVVSHQFEVPGWRAVKTEGVVDMFGQVHRLYLYIVE